MTTDWFVVKIKLNKRNIARLIGTEESKIDDRFPQGLKEEIT